MFRTRRFQSPAIFGAAAAGGGTFTPTSTQASNYFTRVAAITGGNNTNHYGLSTNECVALDALITGLVTDLGGNTSLSTWPIYEALYAMANFSAAVANLNLVSSSFTLVPTNSPTFTADVGYTGGGTAYLDTQFNPTTGTKYLQNDAHIFSYMRTAVSSDVKSVFGTNGTSSHARLYPYFTGTFYAGVNNGSLDSMVATGAKFFAISRVPATGAASDQQYADTTTQGLVAWPSTAPTGTKLVLLADDATGTNTCSAPVALSGFGGGITPTQAGLIKTRLDTYNAAVP